MPTNDQILLDQILNDRRRDLAPDREPAAFFELFVAEQVLKDKDLSSDEIDSGHVAGTRDGGADGIYFFANGELVQEDTDLSSLKLNVAVELVIIQAKEQSGFAESTLDKLIALTADFLDLSADLDALTGTYNTDVLAAMRRFSSNYRLLAARFPVFSIAFHYATKGVTPPHSNVMRKVDRLREEVSRHFSKASVSFTWLGAAELIALARRSPREVHELRLTESPILSTGAFVCLVRLRDFFSFITDEHGKLLRGLFEANVRDYQGKTEVNEGIQATLRDPRSDEFWWLNNGVTILATRAQLNGDKNLTLEDPQIVNGLQTSTEIFTFFEARNTQAENRSLLVRVIEPPVPESRDRIIKATNSQTQVPPASLRATEKIHRDIEEFLGPHGLFYDRRKNFYKNAAKPWDRIISIPQMAQTVMSVALQRPNTARARPSSMLKNDEDYGTVFNSAYPLELYLLCPRIMKLVERTLRASALEQKDRINVRFHFGMVTAAFAAGVASPRVEQVAALQLETITEQMLQDALAFATERYSELGGNDQVSKGAELIADLKERLVERLHRSAGNAVPGRNG